MNAKEINSELWKKGAHQPSRQPLARKKSKLKSRYGGDMSRLAREILRTQQRLGLLLDIQMELRVNG